MVTKIITINDLRLRYREWSGESNLPTMICLHGLGGSSLSFIELADYFSSNYNVISIDTPGHGMSEGFEHLEDYTMDNLVDWLDSFVTELGLNKFIILAHSYGGDIAVHYAIKHEDKVMKLILLDGGYYNKNLQYRFVNEVVKKDEWMGGTAITSLEDECAIYEKDFDEYYFHNLDEYIETESMNYKRLSDELIIALKDLMIEREDGVMFATKGRVAVGAIRAMYHNPSALHLKYINAPTLLLISTEPEYYYTIRKKLLGYIGTNANITFEEVKDTSHFLHWDKPRFVCKRMEEFLY